MSYSDMAQPMSEVPKRLTKLQMDPPATAAENRSLVAVSQLLMKPP